MSDSTTARQADSTATVSKLQPAPTRTHTIDDLVVDVGRLNDRTWVTKSDAAELHDETTQLRNDAIQALVDQRAQEFVAAISMQDALGALQDEGFAWNDVARMVGVSVPALRKWRRGEGAMPENRLRVATLLAFCAVVREQSLHIEDPASWLEVPLVAGVPVTGIDIYEEGRSDLLLRRAVHLEMAPETLLDEVYPDWRSTYDGQFEVFVADDGDLGLRVSDG